MKKFDDLVFEPHMTGDGVASKMFFPNGYGISVVRFKIGNRYGSYTNDNEWEVAILLGNDQDWDLCYDTGITNDVIGHLTDDDVTEIMEQIQKLPMDDYKLN